MNVWEKVLKHLEKNGPRVRKIGCVITLLRVVFGITSGWGVACSLYNRGVHTKAQACFPRFKFAITESSSGNMVCVSMSTDVQHPP
jgi:hypothetical protein